MCIPAAAIFTAGCAAALGPGYTIEKQEIRVRFITAPEPQIRLEAVYQLKNTGNQPLPELELRLPGRRRFHYENPKALWDSDVVTLEASAESPRNTTVVLPGTWTISAKHTLHLSVDYLPAANENHLGFSQDAFFLPAEGWSPELLPRRGLFGSGGVPPKKWVLEVTVPEGFEIHTSGVQKKKARGDGQLVVEAQHGLKDAYPFVAAGRYSATDIGKGKEEMHLWTNQPQESARLKQLSEGLTRVTAAYDAAFGERRKELEQTWIVECPVVAGCLTNLNPSTAQLFGEEGSPRATAEMISQDTMVVDLTAGTPNLAANIAPSLATSWLGYGLNPGYFEQGPPLSLLPAFAAERGREAAEAADRRAETIRRALKLIPEKSDLRQTENQAAVRAKSFLFFYGLQDQYGQDVFRNAIRHVLFARRGKGFELSDLIAAFEEETHANVAEFVRRWMKHPGVPEEFRARYEGKSTAVDAHAHEQEGRR